MQISANIRAALLPLLLTCCVAVWGGAQQNNPPCGPLSAKHESMNCWLAEARRLLKGKKPDSALLILRNMEKFSAGQPLLEGHRLSLLANVCWAKNKFDSCFNYAEASARIFLNIKHLAGASAAHKTMGAALIRKMAPDKAAPYLYKAIELADQAGLDSLKALPYMDLAYIAGQMGDQQKRRTFSRLAYDIAQKYKDHLISTVTGMSLAMGYIEASMLDSARMLAERTLREMQHNRQLMACSYYSLALWETAQGNWEAANRYYLKIKNDESIDAYHRTAFLQGYANFLQDRKLYRKAKPVYEDVMEQARNSGQTDLLYNVAIAYHPMLESMKDYKRAYEVAKYHIRFHDSVYNIQVEEKVREINVKYETAEKERLLQVSKAELAEHTNQRNLLFGGFILVGLLGLTVALRQRYRIKLADKMREQEAEIAQQKIDRLQREQSYLALKSMVAGEEAERNRLAKELHDGLGGMLSSLKLTLTNRKLCISEADLHETVKIVDKASAELRRIAQNMMPEALAKFGLVAALEDLCADLESLTGLQTTFQHYGLREPLPRSMALPLYRITQELLNNVVKHAGANEVILQLIRQDDALHLTIEDNGSGFQLEKALANGGSGLKNLQSRVDFLNGNIEFDSTPGAGTTVNITIPVPKEHDTPVYHR